MIWIDLTEDELLALAIREQPVPESVRQKALQTMTTGDLGSLLRDLIEKWRESAVWEFESGSPEFGKGLDQAADELETLLAARPAAPRTPEGEKEYGK